MTPEVVGVSQDLAGDGQALRPPRLPREAEGAGLRAGRERASRTPSSASRTLADRKKHVYDEDIEALVDEEIATAQRPHQGGGADGDRRHQRSAVGDADARHRRQARAPCRRPATARSTRPSTPSTRSCRTRRELALYQVHAVTEGTDAQAEVSVRLDEDGTRRHRRGRRSRHAGGVRQGLSRRAQQA